MKKKILSFVLVLAFAIMAFPAFGAGLDNDNGKIIIHFYSADNQYTYSDWGGKPDVRWGAYYWLDAGKSLKAVRMIIRNWIRNSPTPMTAAL